MRDVIPDFDVPMVDDLREPLLDCPDGPRQNQGENKKPQQTKCFMYGIIAYIWLIFVGQCR